MRPYGEKAYNTPLLYRDSAWGLRVQRRLGEAVGGKAPDGVLHNVLQDGTHGEDIPNAYNTCRTARGRKRDRTGHSGGWPFYLKKQKSHLVGLVKMAAVITGQHKMRRQSGTTGENR